MKVVWHGLMIILLYLLKVTQMSEKKERVEKRQSSTTRQRTERTSNFAGDTEINHQDVTAPTADSDRDVFCYLIECLISLFYHMATRVRRSMVYTFNWYLDRLGQLLMTFVMFVSSIFFLIILFRFIHWVRTMLHVGFWRKFWLILLLCFHYIILGIFSCD